MRWKRWACSLGLGLALASSSVHAQQGSPGAALGAAVPPPGCATPFPGPGVLPGPAPGQPDAGQPPAAQPPSTDAFAQAPPAGGAETGGFNPSMFGDQLGHSISSSSSSNRPAALATAIRGAYKITENDGPRPQDRVFFTYNYFNNVGGSQRADGTPQTDLHREMIGVEKTFLDGNASIQLRLPFIQVSGGGGASHSDVGDLTIFLKYAMINDRATGNVLTAGLGVTAPTGGDFISGGASGLRSTLLQPYIGAIYNIGDLYIQGFTSFIVPTDSRDVTFWNNDIGFGYWLYRDNNSDRLLTYIVPTLEFHLSDPLNHQGSKATPIGGIDLLDLTVGVNFGLGSSSNLGFAVVTPLTGPKPFDVEGQAYFNWRF